jgi:hypothetical protein
MISLEKFIDFLRAKNFKLGRVYTSPAHLFVETLCQTSGRTVFVVCPPLAFDVSQLQTVKLLTKPVGSAEIQTSEPAINYGCEAGQYAAIVPADKTGRRFVSQLSRLSSFVGKIHLCVLSAGYFGYASGSGIDVYVCPDIQGDTRWYAAIDINDIIEGFSLVSDFETKLVARLRTGMSTYKQTCVRFVSSLEEHLAGIRDLDVAREKYVQQLRRLRGLLAQAQLDHDAAVDKAKTISDAGLRSIMARTIENSKINIQTLESKILTMDLLHRQTVTQLERVVFENTLFLQSAMDNLI